MKRSAMLLAVVGILSLAASAWAAPATSRPEDEKFLDELVKRAAREAPAAAPVEQVKPDAAQPGAEPAKDGDDEEESPLIKALLRKAGAGTDKPIMVEVIDAMGEARTGLRQKLDPGEETQRAEKKTIDLLTKAIDAASKAPPPPSSGKGEKQGKGKPQQGPPKPGEGKPQTNNSNRPAAVSQATQGSLQTGDINKPLAEPRTEWGGIQQRDREEIVEGMSEPMIAKWKDLINKYYEALAKQSQKSDKKD